MALRDLAGSAARMSAGFWKEVARTIDPPDTPDEPSTPAQPEEATSTPPVDTLDGVLVPLETWTRILEQIGNLHEAGQELAAARERAARAETQVEFLREQLAQTKSRPRRPAPTKPTSPAPAEAVPISQPNGRSRLIHRVAPRARVANARNRVGTWISGD